jgi:hypothetical protein
MAFVLSGVMMKRSVFLAVSLFLWTFPLGASQVELRDGRVLSGDIAQIDSVIPSKGEELKEKVRNILIVDDNLRRVYVPRQQVVDVISSTPAEALETFKIPQPSAAGVRRLSLLGDYRIYENFNEFGRRIVMINGTPFVQGITEINPRYVRIQGQDILWDMRVAATSFPREIITNVLMKQIRPDNIEDRKRLVRFYIQGERDQDARRELESILKDFAKEPNIVQELSGIKNAIIQAEARTLLRELELRRNSGQTVLVKKILGNFPLENVSAEILQRVRNMLRQDEEMEQQRLNILAKLRTLPGLLTDDSAKELAGEILKEIEAELDAVTQDRLAAFSASVNDPDRSDEEKLALAMSGWFLGAANAVPDLAAALSMQKTRDLVVQYLIKKDEQNREQIFKEIESEEAGTPENVVRILPVLKPPYPFTAKKNADKPGYYVMSTPSFSADLPPFQYCVQLPPEYNPNRRYPMIVALNGQNTTPDQQMDWWTGSWKNGVRFGQAARQGYIVIAPDWNPENGFPYDYTAEAQAAVLYCYYDALRHFAVDTDRVFLTGHSTGGSAAWDIGLAHPDLWAGIVAVGALSGDDTYIFQQRRNARYVPTYFVGGEIDAHAWMIDNHRNFDHYLQYGFPCTVVQYKGRGQDSFSDEILRIFDWMKLCRREFPRKSFEVNAMRPWDNAFWWVEVEEFSPKNMVDPLDWPVKGVRPALLNAQVNTNNGLRVTCNQALKISVWLAPEIVHFELPTDITINGKKVPLQNGYAAPNLRHILDDVRTRHDRQHPFWLRLDLNKKQ